MHVVFVGRLVCSVNVFYMELSYTGSLDRSTRASEHVTIQISYACKTTAGFINCFPLINILFLMFKLIYTFSLLCMWSLLVDWFVL